ncbi:hypothetical protein ULF88_01005 [Halopseudomonas pachastrellae]|nr:hypothetical protein [Halopseudomonas pachastrellae]
MILAFSPLINSAMRDYLERGIDLLVNCERKALGELLNSTIGEHLPSLVKRFNFRHIVSLDEHEYHQMAFHVSQVLTQDTRCYLRGSADIDTPILFVNGDLDRYTSPEDAQHFNRYIRHCRFATVRAQGIFWIWKAARPGRKPAMRCWVTWRPAWTPARSRPSASAVLAGRGWCRYRYEAQTSSSKADQATPGR